MYRLDNSITTVLVCSIVIVAVSGFESSSSVRRPTSSGRDGSYKAGEVGAEQGYDYIVQTSHTTQTVPGHMTPWIHSYIPTRIVLKASSTAKQLLSNSLTLRRARSADVQRLQRRRRNRRRKLLARLQAAAGLPVADDGHDAGNSGTVYPDGADPAAGMNQHTTATADAEGMTSHNQIGHLLFDITLGDGDADPATNYMNLEQLWLQQDGELSAPEAADYIAYTDTDTAVDVTTATGQGDANLMGGKSKKPWSPVTDWPAAPPGGVYPAPPCMNGMVQQDNRCVCPPGSGPNQAYNGCNKCAEGWVSLGGPLPAARCKPCPQLTTSNNARTACVINVDQPNVNNALCKTCFDSSQPFQPPACCPKGQVCCGVYGCCAQKNCINNGTTNFEPFCCESASLLCPLATGTSYGLDCCTKGNTCLNTSSSAQVCCPIGGVCLGSTTNDCCSSPQTQTCAVDKTGAAKCCSGPFCSGVGTNGACCTAGQYCTGGRKCCGSPNAQVCRDPADTTNLGEICCGDTDTSKTCLSSPLNPGLQLCCPTKAGTFVCNRQCCDGTSQQCVNESVCCDRVRVCPNPLNPAVEICCNATSTCNTATKTCVAA